MHPSPYLASRLQAFLDLPVLSRYLERVNKLNNQPCANSAGNLAQLSSRRRIPLDYIVSIVLQLKKLCFYRDFLCL